MDINARQIPNFDVSKPDNATLLSFMNTVAAKGAADTTMTGKMGNIWTAFSQSAATYDEAYNPSRKDLMSDDLAVLDETRDKSLTAWHVAEQAQLKSPNAAKQQVARQLDQLYKDYKLEAGDEYMKETTNIQQMIQVIEADATIMAALPGMGLDDYLADLKAKNEAFAAKMDERTTGTVGRTKGIVAAARADVEQKYRTLVRMVNVVSSYEGGGVLDQFILVITAEIEHYKQIMARKGVSSGSGSSSGDNGGSGSGDNGDEPIPGGDNNGDEPIPGGDNNGDEPIPGGGSDPVPGVDDEPIPGGGS